MSGTGTDPKDKDTPSMSIAEANSSLTAPGQIFEMEEVDIRGVPTRTWKNAPPTMRSVFDTDLNPEWVLSATAHSTECTSTNMMERSPSPNQISASGSSAIAGNGLNAEVSVSSRSLPMRDIMASAVNTRAKASPMA